MQSSNSSRTSAQRRQQTVSDSSAGPATGQSDSSAMTSTQTAGQVRASSSSARPQRVMNPDKQISQIEKSVTHLLVATKQLLETLTQWSRGQAQEEEVSDVYVRLGYEFNLACRAFNSIGVETGDLGPVPDLLRHILEDTLSQPASPQALDNYLPRIRDIIINLLQGLKKKQSKLRAKGSREITPAPKPPSEPMRQGSVSGIPGVDPGLSQTPTDFSDALGGAQIGPQQDVINYSDNQAYSSPSAQLGSRSSLSRQSLRREGSRSSQHSAPVLPVYKEPTMSMPPQNAETFAGAYPPPPPPPPKSDALTALQRGGDLERRASRRFSTIQISRLTGAPPNGIPVIPPAQNSPIPNRGRELRESMTAVRSRAAYQSSRTSPSSRRYELSPDKTPLARPPEVIAEEPDPDLRHLVLDTKDIPKIIPPTEVIEDESPTVKTPEEYHKAPYATANKPDLPNISATLQGPIDTYPDEYRTPTSVHDTIPPPPPQHQEMVRNEDSEPLSRSTVTPPPTQATDVDQIHSRPKSLTLFLQYKSKIKKFVLPEGYNDLTMARLQLAFVEKFAWNTTNDGVDLPEIYVQDPVSGIRHELEDLSDVKDRSVLVLNVEVLDEVKKHFDEGMGTLQKTLEGVRSLLDGQGSLMQRFSDRQLETSKEMARMSTLPSQRPSRTPTLTQDAFPAPTEQSLQEVQTLRREIAVLRQTYSTMSSDFTAAMTDIKGKAAHVKAAAAEASVPSYKGDAGRAHINQGKKTLMQDSETLVNRVDDLSDMVEELRKDVVSRGVRPLPRQLELISKEISLTAKELATMKDFMKREKPIWTKIWESELQMVMVERDDLTQQEELMADLHGDLEDVTGVFKLVQEATIHQNVEKDKGKPAGLRPVKNLNFERELDPLEAKSGMLDEVRALQPNHENRLEAIRRAELIRDKELSTRKVNEFQREVENFVEEGKLKKTGGTDEVERMRKIREERARKEASDFMAARRVEMERKRSEAAAARQAAAAEEAANTNGEVGDGNASQQHSTMQTGAADGVLEVEPPFQDANSRMQSPAIEKNDEMSLAAEGDGIYKLKRESDGPPQLPEVNLS